MARAMKETTGCQLLDDVNWEKKSLKKKLVCIWTGVSILLAMCEGTLVYELIMLVNLVANAIVCAKTRAFED